MTKTLRIMLPIPVAGARFGAVDGLWLPDRAFIAVAELAGIHAIGLNYLDRAPEQFRLEISVRARDLNSADLRALSDRVILPRSGDFSDLPLIHLRERFLQLFSLSEDLDCQIDLTLEGNRVYRRLRVGRYEQQLKLTDENMIALVSSRYRGHVEQSVIDGLELEVCSLLHPIERGYPLKPCITEGVRTGEWFCPLALKPGPWLVMPAKTQNAAVRPTIYVQPGYLRKEDGRLRDAIAITDERERRDAISTCLRRMADDYGHKDWRFVFETLDAYKHLPATTLDLWDVFAQHSDAMAMLLIAADETDYQSVVNVADQLPFIWELVPMGAWFSALNALKQYILNSAPEGIANALAEHAVKQKLSFMFDADSILERPAKILAAVLLNEHDEEMSRSPLFTTVPNLINQMLEAASADLRKRQSADVHWPVVHGHFLSWVRESAPEICDSLFTQQAAYMTSVLHTPVVLATRVAARTGVQIATPSPADLFALKQVRTFDDVWYREAFGLTLLYLHAWDEVDYLNNKNGNS
jgi:hypothetical protein